MLLAGGLVAVGIGLAACDGNLFEGLGNASGRDSSIEAARLALDRGEFDAAIDLLTPLLDGDPADVEARSLLASAYLGRGGIDVVRILDEVTLKRRFDQPGDAFQLLVEVLPFLTARHGADFATARGLLTGGTLGRGDCFQLAVAAAAHLVATTVLSADPDQDGHYTVPGGAELGRLTSALNTDLAALEHGVTCAVLDRGGEILEFLEDFRRDLDTDGDGVITEAEVTRFIEIVLR